MYQVQTRMKPPSGNTDPTTGGVQKSPVHPNKRLDSKFGSSFSEPKKIPRLDEPTYFVARLLGLFTAAPTSYY